MRVAIFRTLILCIFFSINSLPLKASACGGRQSVEINSKKFTEINFPELGFPRSDANVPLKHSILVNPLGYLRVCELGKAPCHNFGLLNSFKEWCYLPLGTPLNDEKTGLYNKVPTIYRCLSEQVVTDNKLKIENTPSKDGYNLNLLFGPKGEVLIINPKDSRLAILVSPIYAKVPARAKDNILFVTFGLAPDPVVVGLSTTEVSINSLGRENALNSKKGFDHFAAVMKAKKGNWTLGNNVLLPVPNSKAIISVIDDFYVSEKDKYGLPTIASHKTLKQVTELIKTRGITPVKFRCPSFSMNDDAQKTQSGESAVIIPAAETSN